MGSRCNHQNVGKMATTEKNRAKGWQRWFYHSNHHFMQHVESLKIWDDSEKKVAVVLELEEP